MKKRGLSTVVTSLIIILLVLVAVGIIWIVVVNIISDGTEQISLGKLTLDLKIKNVNVDNSTNNISIIVKRNPGAGELSGLKFVVSDGVNTQVFEEEDVILGELGSRSFTFHLGELNVFNIESVSIAPVFKTKSGKKFTGNVVDSYQVKEGSSNGGAFYQNCVTDLGGTCCSSGALCQGGSFQSSSDCGSLCCVGGTCCTPDCSCASSTCVGSTCPDTVCGTNCAGTLAPDCGARVCGPAPNGCGSADECGTCNVTSNCVDGVCEIFSYNITGLVSWWRFEGDAQDEMGLNHGVVYGDVQFIVDAERGNVSSFDGDGDYIGVGDLFDTGAYTKIAWVKRELGTGNHNIISDNANHAFWIPGSVGVSAGHNPAWTIHVQDPNQLQLSTWYFVAVTFDPNVNSGEMKLYRDGIEVDNNINIPAQLDSSNTYIGSFGTVSCWFGQIDEVRIYNRSLSVSEIQQVYVLG